MQEIIASLKRYEDHKIPCGSFLNAVLENNLLSAVGHADHINRHRIYEIVQYIYNELPNNIWGSPEKVREHLEKEFIQKCDLPDELRVTEDGN